MVPCKIRPMDIEAMDYWLNQAPISDPPSQNAICFALRRLLLPGTNVRVVADSTGNANVFLDGKPFALPPELTKWYKNAVAGHQMEPLTDFIPLPWEVLSRRVQAELRDARVERAASESQDFGEASKEAAS